MKKMQKGAAAVLLSASLLASPVLAATTPTFRDVAVTDWSYSFVTRAAEENLVSGMGDGTFGAHKKLSSAQFITMVCNLFYREEVDSYQETYQPAEWWRSFMAVAYGKGLLDNTVVGDSRAATKQWKSSVVNAEISRYDMAQVMVNVLTAQEWEGVTPQEVLQFQQKIADWDRIPAKYQTAVATAYAKSFLSGMDQQGTFAGEQSMTRTHGAVVICKLLDARNEAEENRANAPTFTNTTKLVNGKEPTAVNVYAALQELEKEFPTGYAWNMTKPYKSPVLGSSTGRDALVYLLADRVFGNLALDTARVEDVKPGDLIYLDSGETILVEDVQGNEITYTSCSTSGRVSWGNVGDLAALGKNVTVYTRYEDRDWNTQTADDTLANGKPATTANAKALVDKFLRERYDAGDPWGEDEWYKAPQFSTGRVYGNEAFAYYLSDYVFGDLPVQTVGKYADLRVGDVIYYDEWDEYLVVTDRNGDEFSYIGVYREKVYRDKMNVSKLSARDAAYTRYPDAQQETTLSNGKTATTRNVTDLMSQFTAWEYGVGATYDKAYQSDAFSDRTVYGDKSFAYYLSDYVFGSLRVREVSSLSDLRVGDVLYHHDWDEYLVVSGISGNDLTVLGVSHAGKVYQSTLKLTALDSRDFAYTRYPT